MSKLKIALLSIAKPNNGSGNGTIEYAYQLYSNFTKNRNFKTKASYLLEDSKRNDIFGLIYAYSIVGQKIRVALNANNYNIIHITTQELGSLAKSIKNLKKNSKIVITVHDLARFHQNLHDGLLQKIYNKLIRVNVSDGIKNSDLIIFDSKMQYLEAVSKFGNIPKYKILPLGINDQFINRKITKNKTKYLKVGYIGSFAKHKNVMFILKIAKLFKNNSEIKFILYGTGSDENNIKKYIRDNKLKNISLLGFAPESKKLSIYDSFDIFIFPSLYEGFGLPIIEAQARGLPVIIYKTGKISPEVGKYCLKAKNPFDAHNIIANLKNHNYKEKKQAIRYARNFTWKKTCKETLKAYGEVLKSKSIPQHYLKRS